MFHYVVFLEDVLLFQGNKDQVKEKISREEFHTETKKL